MNSRRLLSTRRSSLPPSFLHHGPPAWAAKNRLLQVQGLTGVYPRFLYDTLFGFVPGVKQFLEAAGGSTGTTGNCEALMSAVSLRTVPLVRVWRRFMSRDDVLQKDLILASCLPCGGGDRG